METSAKQFDNAILPLNQPSSNFSTLMVGNPGPAKDNNPGGYCHWRVGSICIFIFTAHLNYKILGSWFTFKHIHGSNFKHQFWIREQLGYHNIFCFLQGLPENSPWANICYVNLAAIMQPKPVKQLMHQRYHFSIIPYHHPTPPNKKDIIPYQKQPSFSSLSSRSFLFNKNKKRNHIFFSNHHRKLVDGL